MNVEAPKGVLLYGPPGVGKTQLVKVISEHCHAKLTVIQGPSILGPYLGDSELRLRERFASAYSADGPSILFIDEIDSLAPTRTSGGNPRLVAQLLTLMDGLHGRGRLIVIGATNRPNALDPALRRPGRFDREISIDVPDQRDRSRILQYYLSRMPCALDVDQLAASTVGYVGADLAALCREAALLAVGKGTVTMAEFSMAMRSMTASTRRGLGVDVADTKWEDVGGLDDVKQQLKQAVEWPVRYAETMQRLGVRPPRGILLYGPPGCSKTTLVRVLATQMGSTFISINGAALYSPFVGDSERALRDVFRRARSARPAIVFFDEIDAIVGKRMAESRGDTVQERILSTMLNEMDGVQCMDGVMVVAATNRIDMIDGALLRPGRFDKIIYVGVPDFAARREILGGVEWLAGETEGYSGADLKNLVREASLLALREDLVGGVVGTEHYRKALQVVQPSLKSELMEYYTRMRAEYG
ncbi:hypothetical protein IWW37_004873 [Coemansia sp. RSA 2050]|nr:hypothetical protein IWW37_004873 [Coemansia sp. RSA 2050]KAJ2731095.1 hypothetical protein IW152_004801 [Coemansia sp. BCRC 34962]